MIHGHHLRIAVIPDFVAVVVIKFLTGQIAVIECGMSATRNDNIKAVFKCRFSQADLLDVYFSDDKGIEDEHFVEKNDSNIGHHRAIVSEEIIRGYYGEIQDFLECMLEGREPLSGFQIAREAAELTQIAYLAAEQNRTVVL